MTKAKRRRIIAALIVAVAVAGSAFLGNIRQQPEPVVQPDTQRMAVQSSPAVEALGRLAIKGRAPKTGYARVQFGQGWADAGKCDVRNVILKRDMVDVRLRSGTDCTVLSGTLHDPYSGKTVMFVRGTDTSDDVQIDHVVALGDAWQKGAQVLEVDTRRQFANDPLNLLAVDGPTNNAKSDSDASSWLPPNKAYRCRYVARQIAVKIKYQLWVTQAEHDAMDSVLGSCPGQVLPIVTDGI